MNVIILAGGSGTRLWPLSRPDRAKQFIKLRDLSFYQETLHRANLLVAGNTEVKEAIIVVAPEEQRRMCENQAVECGLDIDFLTEPAARGTAPAIALACSHLAKCGQADQQVIIMPCDHYFADVMTFVHTINHLPPLWNNSICALSIAASDDIDWTQLGNIIVKDDDREPYRSVAQFHEKPKPDLAHYWTRLGGDKPWKLHRLNAGIFLSTPQTILSWTWRFNFSVGVALYDSMLYQNLPVLSFDREILTKMTASEDERKYLFTVDISDSGWSDIGTWDSLKKVMQKEVEVYFDVSRRERENKWEPQIETRPWGWFKVLHEHGDKKIKLLHVAPGEETSFQSHEHRGEVWVCLCGLGAAQVERKPAGTLNLRVSPDTNSHCQSKIFIPPGTKHRLKNIGEGPLCVLEIQTGDYLGEDDIQRYEDKYGRGLTLQPVDNGQVLC